MSNFENLTDYAKRRIRKNGKRIFHFGHFAHFKNRYVLNQNEDVYNKYFQKKCIYNYEKKNGQNSNEKILMYKND